MWKRCRRSLKDKRDPVEFAKEQEIQTFLHQADAAGELKVYYFDAAGFSTTPCIPYAWQPKSDTLKLPSQRSKQLNILGFLHKNNEGFFYPHEGSVTSQVVIDAFEDFGQHYAEHYRQTKRPCIVIIDNAPVHTSAAFLKKREEWYSYGIGVHFLPAYSPELNLIEILWRKMKYEWLPFTAYSNYQSLKSEVLNVLDQVGKKYTMTFS